MNKRFRVGPCSSLVNSVGPVIFVWGPLLIVIGPYMYCVNCFWSFYIFSAGPLVCVGPLYIGVGPVSMVQASFGTCTTWKLFNLTHFILHDAIPSFSVFQLCNGLFLLLGLGYY